MRADVLVEILKALPQIQMVINRKRLWMRIETERAQATSKPRHFQVKLFRMAAFRGAKVPEHREAGIDRVYKPETRDFLRRESCHTAASAARAGKCRALFVQNSNQAPGDHHQALTCGDLQTGRDEPGIVKKMSSPIAHDAGNRKAHHSLASFHVKQESNIFPSKMHRTVVPAGIVVLQASDFGGQSDMVVLCLRFHEAIGPVRLP